MTRLSGVFPALAVLLLCAAPARTQVRPPGSGSTARTFSISGTVRDQETSQTIEMLKVELKKLTGEVVSTSFTRSNGEFSFSGLPNGVYYIVIEEKGYEPVREGVEIFNASRSGIFIFLRKPFEVTQTASGASVSARELSIPRKAHEALEKGRARLYDKNDFRGSLALFERAVGTLPTYYEAYHMMGVAYMRLEQPAEAEQAFRKAIELSSQNYPPPYVDLAALLTSQKRFADAEPLARHGVELNASAWQGHYELARALLGLNQLDPAEKSARQARTLKSDFAPAHLLLANIHIRKQDTRALIEDLDAYLKIEPNGPNSEQARRTREKLQQALAKSQPPPADPPKP